MHLKLRAVADGVADDVVVDLDQRATIGELAQALFPSSVPPGRAATTLSLVVDEPGRDRRHLPPLATVAGLPVRSGSTVRPSSTMLAASHPREVAEVVIVDGPGAPATIGLRPGWNTIGRSATCDVTLPDPMISRRHARVLVGDQIVLVDDGAANGITSAERRVDRMIVHGHDRLVLGATTLMIRRLAEGDEGTGTHVAFNRSPRIDPTDTGLRLSAPEPPAPPAPQRFPLATVLAPIVLAAVLFAFTQSLLTVLFFALSPILMIGSWWETRTANRKQVATDTARFRTELGELAERLAYAQQLERRGRCRELPSVVETIDAVLDRTPLMWTRRSEQETFATLRLGTGTLPSRTSVELPGRSAALPGLWEELDRTVARFAAIDGVPVPAALRDVGNVGVTGPASVCEPVTRSVITQLVALHAPGDLRIVALGGGTEREWLKWLPHTTAMADGGSDARRLVDELDRTIAERGIQNGGQEATCHLPVTVVVVDHTVPIDRSRLVTIAERGPAVGVHTIWSAPAVEQLPAACRAFVDVDGNTGWARVGLVHDGRAIDDVVVEPVGAAAAERLALTLSPVVDAGAPVDVDTELPTTVPVGDVFGDDVAIDPDAIVERWSATEHERGLRAVIGVSTSGPLALDLRADGPHALVGGTTGSGKSEFLQSWILALALDHRPERLNFLLVDYKGGAAFAECVHLPHCVGLVTDLRPRLVRRALVSLRAELRRREEVLHARGAKDLAELEAMAGVDAPASLVIVVDELAALVAEVPEFIDGLVDVAQRGRSLGLHLVLATQRPAGVITDHIRANTNVRVALRMADAADSDDVIGSSDAAHFDHDVPGRAIVTTGPGRTTTMQALYAGGSFAGRRRRAPVALSTLGFGPARSRARETSPPPSGDDRADIERIVGIMRVAATRSGTERPRRPWLPELAARYRWELLPTPRRDDHLVFAVADDPDTQTQPPVAFRPDDHGNIAIYGAGGAGKSTALRTLAIAAGFGLACGGPSWVYGIDAGGRGLEPLAQLPHVGAVIPGDDDERIQRLLRYLESELEDRAASFVAAEASTIGEFRQRTGEPVPRLFLLVDGVGAFRDEYEGGVRHGWWERFVRLAVEGRSVGVHVAVTADRPAALSSSLAAAMQSELVLRLANELDVAAVDPAAATLGADAPPGRGVLAGREVQVAVIGGDGSLAAQSAAMVAAGASMCRAGTPPAPAIGSLPSRVAMSDLPLVDGAPALGLRSDDLSPVGFPPTDGFLVAGDARTGVSTATATVVRTLAGADARREFVLLGARRSPLASIVSWAAAAQGAELVAELAARLADRLDEDTARRLVVVVEAVPELLDTEADAPVQGLLRACRELGAIVVADGDTGSLGGSWPLLQAVKAYRCGIVLQPDQMDGDALFKVSFPRTPRHEFPVGRALLVVDGIVERIQVAVPE